MYEVTTLSVYMEEGLSAQFDIYQLRKWKWTQSVGPKVGSQMREWVSANDVIQVPLGLYLVWIMIRDCGDVVTCANNPTVQCHVESICDTEGLPHSEEPWPGELEVAVWDSGEVLGLIGPASQQTQATCGVTIKERWDDGENDHQDGDKNEKHYIDFSSHLLCILIPSPS